MCADRKAVARGAMTMVDRMQDFPPEVQIAAAAVVFQELVDAYGVKPQDVMTAASNMRKTVAGTVPEFGAVRDYIRYEIVR
jgi:hypothetical protein